MTLNDMKAKQEALVKEREKQLAKKEQSKELQLWVASSQPAASPSGRGAGLVLGGGSGWCCTWKGRETLRHHQSPARELEVPRASRTPLGLR